mgnify:FL=1
MLKALVLHVFEIECCSEIIVGFKKFLAHFMNTKTNIEASSANTIAFTNTIITVMIQTKCI